MPFERPTLTELLARVKGDLAAHLPGADTQTRRGNLAVLAATHAGATHGLYGYLDRMARQVLPDTAETAYLERHAAVWGLFRKAAAKAAGNVVITGNTGAVLPAGAELARADNYRYVTNAEATLVGGAATVGVTAKEAGAAWDAPAETSLTMTGFANGMESAATVDADGISGGADAESDDALRGRVLARIQEPPHGGRGADYEAWALEVPGVTRAYVYPSRMGAGTVGVAVLTDDAAGGPIPGQEVLDLVAAHIAPLRPVCATVYVFAPVAAPVDFDIRITPDTTAVRAAVQAELADLFRREAEPEGTLLISHVREAVSTAVGETDHAIISPAANVAAGAGELSTLGEFTWTEA